MIDPNRTSLPAISVITPFYNRADFLEGIIETLHAQTFRDFELVIVDDGSDDDLNRHVGKVETRFPIQLLRLGHNKGAASARNVGIENARGRYVALLDSDDAWQPEKLARQFQQLENAEDRNLLVSLTRQLVVGSRTYQAPRRLLTRFEPVGEYLFQRQGIIQSSMMFMAADLARSVLFEEGGRGHDDWSFALRLERAGARFEMLPEALTIYNNAGGRVRRSPGYSAARLDWLERWRSSLGEGPYLAARAAFVSNMSDGGPPRALRMIGTALWRNAIPVWRAVYYAVTLVFPAVRKGGVLAKELGMGAGRVTSRQSDHGADLTTPAKENPGRGLLR